MWFVLFPEKLYYVLDIFNFVENNILFAYVIMCAVFLPLGNLILFVWNKNVVSHSNYPYHWIKIGQFRL